MLGSKNLQKLVAELKYAAYKAKHCRVFILLVYLPVSRVLAFPVNI